MTFFPRLREREAAQGAIASYLSAILSMNKLLEENPHIALEINQFIDKRKKAIDLAKGTLEVSG